MLIMSSHNYITEFSMSQGHAAALSPFKMNNATVSNTYKFY